MYRICYVCTYIHVYIYVKEYESDEHVFFVQAFFNIPLFLMFISGTFSLYLDTYRGEETLAVFLQT